jgi:hypothetical protein
MPEVQRPGPFGQRPEIEPAQRLAARQDQRRNAETRQILQHAHRLIVGQLARERHIGAGGIAVPAFQIAAARQVPDHHRPDAACSDATAWRGGCDQFLHVLRQAKHH